VRIVLQVDGNHDIRPHCARQRHRNGLTTAPSTSQ
jgi:hypothetical protein